MKKCQKKFQKKFHINHNYTCPSSIIIHSVSSKYPIRVSANANANPMPFIQTAFHTFTVGAGAGSFTNLHVSHEGFVFCACSDVLLLQQL
jgi:hypothetical protein